MIQRLNHKSGFTFIEVMVAIVIFVVAVLAAVDLARGSVSATRDAREVSVATFLLQGVLTELETKIEIDGEKACEKKKEGKFEAPYEAYTYVTYCNEIDFHIAEAVAKTGEDGKEPEASTTEVTKTDQLKQMIILTASDYISKAIRELHVEVLWKQGKNPRKVDVTTHVARYDLPFQMNAGVAP